MGAAKANCLICAKPLVYFEDALDVTCAICGKKETGHSICEDGHYVCDTCHRQQGVDHVIEECKMSTSKNPVELADQLMNHRSIYPNGPEHHTLIGAALMTAYKNAGGDIDLEKGLAELLKRSMCVPGGTCGFWGCCGAATSSGQFYSIISGSTPMKHEEWGRTQRLTSNILGRLADYGGPRCCKRVGFLAILEAVPYVAETTGVQMELPDTIMCRYFPRNAECLRTHCPFFPEGATHPNDREVA